MVLVKSRFILVDRSSAIVAYTGIYKILPSRTRYRGGANVAEGMVGSKLLAGLSLLFWSQGFVVVCCACYAKNEAEIDDIRNPDLAIRTESVDQVVSHGLLPFAWEK